MHLLLCSLVEFPTAGLIVDKGNRVIYSPDIERRKLLAHHGEWNEDAKVYGVVIAMANFLQRANDLKANSVQEDCASNRRPAGEHDATSFVSKHYNGALLRDVEIIQPA